jgi:hypothetical protein
MSSVTARPALVIALLVVLTACGGAESRVTGAQDSPSRHASPSRAESPSPVHHTASAPVPCNPGGGHPIPSPSCPDRHPTTGWVRRGDHGSLRLQPFRTLTNDAHGRAWARHHHLAYPFSDDYFDARVGEPQPLRLTPGTVCTGIILVGYAADPLHDHRVGCHALVTAVSRLPVPVAVWRSEGRVFQVSELYRP